MKKYLAVILVAVFMVACVGCGESNEEKLTSSKNQPDSSSESLISSNVSSAVNYSSSVNSKIETSVPPHSTPPSPTVKLTDMEPFKTENGGILDFNSRIEDNFGNNYDYGFSDSGKRMSVFYLNKEYKSLSGTWATSSRSEECYSIFVIKGDNTVLLRKEIHGGDRPEKFNIDISNVVDLEIEIENSSYNWTNGSVIFLAEPLLTRK